MLLFWICCAVLTVGVVVALTRPLVAGPRASSAAHDADRADLAVYRDQLSEVEADRERGLIGNAEAEAARVEIARRLLARAEALGAVERPISVAARGKGDERLFYAIALAVPALALLLYLNVGAPGLPGQPHAQRVAQTRLANAPLDDMIAKVQARLRENPSDGMGWEVIAPVYLRLERYVEAAEAYQRSAELLGPTAKRLAGLAEASVLANNGVVTETARRAYERMLALEPGRPDARFGLALAKEQDGDLGEAEAAYRALLAETPPDASWREFITARLDAIAERRGETRAAEPTTKAPEAQVAQNTTMILGMVEGLEAKLKADGRDVEGWQRLLKSWSVLGRKEKAEAALQDARKALAGNDAALGQLNAFARSLGLGA